MCLSRRWKGRKGAAKRQPVTARDCALVDVPPSYGVQGFRGGRSPHTPSPRPSMQVSSRFPSSLGRAAPSGFGVRWLWLGLWRCFWLTAIASSRLPSFSTRSVPYLPPSPSLRISHQLHALATPAPLATATSSHHSRLETEIVSICIASVRFGPEPTRSAQDATHPLRRPSPAVDQSSPHHSVQPSSTAQHQASAWIVEQLPVSFSAPRLSKLSPSSLKGIPARNS